MQANKAREPAPTRTSTIVRRKSAGPIGQPYLPVSVVGPLWPPSLPVHAAPAPLDNRGLEGGEETSHGQPDAADTKSHAPSGDGQQRWVQGRVERRAGRRQPRTVRCVRRARLPPTGT